MVADAQRSLAGTGRCASGGRSITGLGVVALSLLLAAPWMGTQHAHAGSLARAKKLFRAAEGRFAAGEYQKAGDLYRQAYEQKPLPALWINIGQCHRKLGDCVKANAAYRRYLVAQPTGRHRAKVEALIKACDEELAATRLLQEQQKRQEEAQAKEGQSSATPPPEPEPKPVQPQRKGLHPIYFWSSVGLATAMLLTGAVTGGIALSKSSRYKDPATPAADLPALRDQGGDLKVAANVTFGIGIGAAVGAAVLFFFTDFGSAKEQSPGQPTVTAAPTLGGGTVSVGATF